MRKGWIAAAFGVVWIGASTVMSSCSSVERAAVVPARVPDAEYVGNSTCSNCHGDIEEWFEGTPHSNVRIGSTAEVEGIGCELCHGPGSRHVNSGGNWQGTIVNPGKEPKACLRCHVEIESDLRLPHRHPVLEGHMNCVQCHDPHGRDIMAPSRGPAMARGNQTCAECHTEQTRSFVFEHEALREGCAVCHDVHGSPNPKMLRQADNNLCLKCHAQVQGPAVPQQRVVIGKVDHTAFIRQGACWSCHTSIHGSNIDPRMRN